MIKDRLDFLCFQIIEVVFRRLSLNFEVGEYLIGFGRLEWLYFLWSGCSFEFDDFGDLVDSVFSGKQRPSAVKLVDETA